MDGDDQAGLIAALTEAIADPVERRRRGELAAVVARERYSWTAATQLLGAQLHHAIATATTSPSAPIPGAPAPDPESIVPS